MFALWRNTVSWSWRRVTATSRVPAPPSTASARPASPWPGALTEAGTVERPGRDSGVVRPGDACAGLAWIGPARGDEQRGGGVARGGQSCRSRRGARRRGSGADSADGRARRGGHPDQRGAGALAHACRSAATRSTAAERAGPCRPARMTGGLGRKADSSRPREGATFAVLRRVAGHVVDTLQGDRAAAGADASHAANPTIVPGDPAEGIQRDGA